MEWSEWSAWSECEDDQIFRTRECSGIFCDEETETETKDEPCLKVRNNFRRQKIDLSLTLTLAGLDIAHAGGWTL